MIVLHLFHVILLLQKAVVHSVQRKPHCDRTKVVPLGISQVFMRDVKATGTCDGCSCGSDKAIWGVPSGQQSGAKLLDFGSAIAGEVTLEMVVASSFNVEDVAMTHTTDPLQGCMVMTTWAGGDPGQMSR
ncbi:uncharacterized protein B0I36DRAFT_355017 [Microdochium trichocladiopsis]|uniref:Uncharacterized protein n=1 Tax=Microdochium trichocladiopsis TaxID=1682393 RepID=A0A9P8XUI5_9PEZI|nr:uncharacterized protein B0I36DRAFT_355017 [Microdochium trichocladiopsis]KAH7016169.1 hypothetical protein B0I36DRAFT_355017 [Microdochium trichocladiopsis]